MINDIGLLKTEFAQCQVAVEIERRCLQSHVAVPTGARADRQDVSHDDVKN